ncbi:hypothetical protein NDN08_007361 [Rhodosorus marinus]|uniref:Essential protein Yae1 N-terminal domain-containing protein n=1 Tax=Rhodosorus marinus TaxID=101924 RepID=A0AAV8UJJ4_9RHOD|nr:hypothetical protein NDN08_007361 [Rhodosorus marinus]
MDEEDDFFGSQSDSNEKTAGQRELEVVQGRFRASGYREAFASTKEQALQEGFEKGFERGVQASEELGFWLGVVVVIQKLSGDGKLSVDAGDKHQLDLFKLSLKSYVENGSSSLASAEPGHHLAEHLSACSALCAKYGFKYTKIPGNSQAIDPDPSGE